MGRSPSKRGSPWPLAILSLALLLIPAAQSQPPRLYLSLLFVPLRWSSDAASSLLARAAGIASSTGPEEKIRLDFLQSKVHELQAKVSDLQGQIDTLSGVRNTLKEPKFNLLPAYVVVSTDSNAWRRSMVLLRGSSQGVRKGMLVLWEKHLVGRVMETSPLICRVQLITDSGFRVGAVAQPKLYDNAVPLATRDLGILEGSGDGHAVLKWMAGEALVEEGATVITAPDPEAGIPRGLVLGRVAAISRAHGLYPRVDVVPYLNLRALDSVVIVLGAGE